MTRLALYQIDAFTNRVFGGNPAAVVPLDAWLDDALMQSIAAENNVSETAFFVPAGPSVPARDAGEGGDASGAEKPREAGGRYALRWFSPAVEVKLCGHGTLAAAHLIFTTLEPHRRELRFETASGELGVTRGGAGELGATRGDDGELGAARGDDGELDVTRGDDGELDVTRGGGGEPGVTRDDDGDLLVLDFPRWELRPLEHVPAALEEGLCMPPEQVFITATGDNLFALFASESEIRALEPDMRRLATLHPAGVVATARGTRSDCVCRYFAPSYGIPEDPGTGSIHCGLAPFWSAQLGRARIHSLQLSKRGSELWCEVRGARTSIAGRAVTYLEGSIEV